MSHDIRGHLNSVLLMIELLRRDLGPRAGFEEQTSDLDTMKRSVLDTVNCVDRLVCAERFRQGLLKPKAGKVDFASLVPTLKSQFVLPAQERGAKLEISATGDAHADRHLLGLAVGCLIANAVNHGSGDTVRVELEGLLAGAWRVRVSDGGGTSGAVPTPATRILDEAADPAQLLPGIPLGLRLVRHIAETMNARLSAHCSTPWLTFELSCLSPAV